MPLPVPQLEANLPNAAFCSLVEHYSAVSHMVDLFVVWNVTGNQLQAAEGCCCRRRSISLLHQMLNGLGCGVGQLGAFQAELLRKTQRKLSCAGRATSRAKCVAFVRRKFSSIQAFESASTVEHSFKHSKELSGQKCCYNLRNGPVAQSVEQRIENPCVGGSIPPQATSLIATYLILFGAIYGNSNSKPSA